MIEDAESTTLSFVASRLGGTACPSEVARSLAKDDDAPLEWCKFMPVVHEAVDVLVARGEITLTWKSVVLDGRVGPYRISARKQIALQTVHSYQIPDRSEWAAATAESKIRPAIEIMIRTAKGGVVT